MKRYHIIIGVLLLIVMGVAQAQTVNYFKKPDAVLTTLDDLVAYNVILPSSASDALFAPLDIKDEPTYRAYYQALSALHRNDNDAPSRIAAFIKTYPTYHRSAALWLQWGDYQFRHKRYKQALKIYQEVDMKSLSPAQQAEFKFKQAYTYFKLEQYDKAMPLFEEVSRSHGEKADYAAYYYAYLLFGKQEYNKALIAFKSIASTKLLKPIVPYYIAQIYNAQKEYAQLIKEGQKLERAVSSKWRPAVAGLVGIAYFETQDYAAALPLMEKDKNLQHSPYGNYRIGYAAMQSGQYEKAIRHFEKVQSRTEDIYQNALIMLGNSYLEIGNKDFAAKAFYQAYQQDTDAKLKEDALFNFAKLSYELNNDPYQKAIHALTEYIENNPSSERMQEANTYLVNLFLSSQNYKEAYARLQAMPNKNNKLQQAYQKIAFNRGVELFTANEFEQAEAAFAQATTHGSQASLKAKALYWQAASHYAQASYWKAIELWQQALKSYRQNGLSAPPRTYYNIAFSYYQLKRYTKAIKWFERSVQQHQLSKDLKADSYLRMADAYFVTKHFDKAIASYQEAMFESPKQSDYASYQIALSQGGKGDFNAKTRALSTFGQKYSASNLADDALFELGTTYLILNKNNEAIDSFNNLCAKYPKSPFKKQALLKAGLCYYNIDNNQRAVEVLKQVVADYKGSKEAKEALNSIQNIYVESDKAQDFINYANTLPNAGITGNRQDSITYMAAEHAYMSQGNTAKAIADFSQYITQYPQGHFQLYAHFYRGECLMREKEYSAAKQDYDYVLTHSSFDFVETSLVQMGRIAAKEADWKSSLRYFQRLFKQTGTENFVIESLDGQLEAYKQLGMYDSLLMIGQTILNRPNMPARSEQKAHAYVAHAALQLNKLDLAEKEYSIVGKIAQGEIAVEALYNQALIQYKLQQYKAAETKLLDLIQSYASYDTWVTKSFILLADIYTAYGQLYQAKQTLQSVIEHQEDTTLVNIAIKKKLAIEQMEAQQAQDSVLQNDSAVLGE